MQMRLRRSDFWFGDYPKRQAWKHLRAAMREEGNASVLAWAMRRANGRGLYALYRHAPFLAGLEAIAELCDRQSYATSHDRAVLTQLHAVMPPDDYDLAMRCLQIYPQCEELTKEKQP